jgi:hypothetical protein
LRLAREADQVLRLQAFRAAHPDVIIGDGGSRVRQARVESRTASMSSAVRSASAAGKLDELTGERRSQSDSGQD